MALAPLQSGTTPSRRRVPRESVAPSLKDVASAAGVSTATASRALARPQLVGEGLRARVLQAAQRLGYVGNAAARFLSARRSGLVGAILGERADPIAWQMLQAAERTLSAHGVGLLVRVAAGSTLAECAHSLLARGVDGLLFVGGSATAQAPDLGPGRTVPWIGCGQEPGGETIEHRALRLACAYLQQLGHRRIGTLWPRSGGAGEGWTDDVAETISHPVDDLQHIDGMRAAVRALLGDGMTGIVAGSDLAAVAILRECRGMSLAVPQRISIIGWGDTALAKDVEPRLTSVRVPAGASGRAGAEYLLAAIAGQDFRWPHLPLKLVIRESTGPAAA